MLHLVFPPVRDNKPHTCCDFSAVTCYGSCSYCYCPYVLDEKSKAWKDDVPKPTQPVNGRAQSYEAS